MIQEVINLVDSGISAAQTFIYIDVLQPLLFHFNLMGYDEDIYDALYWVLIGMLQIGLSYVLLRPLEALRPLEQWQNRRPVRVDVIYTWIAKLGILNLLFFVVLQPVFNRLQSQLVMHGFTGFDLDGLYPGVTDKPLVSFTLYLVLLDFAGYWYHRWQHRFGVWWEFHAVHHSQQQLSLWSDDRNHFLDNILEATFFACIALLIGVQPTQYVILVAVSSFLQSVQHVNARLNYGWVLERLLVSPGFHRRHHAIEYGHKGTRYGCNFGVLFPWWDMIFHTASWERGLEPTGIRDQLPAPTGRSRGYGVSVIEQQILAIGRATSRARWLLRRTVND